MQDSWHFDGSIVSLSDVDPAPGTDRDPSARDSRTRTLLADSHPDPCAGPAVALSATLIDAGPASAPAPAPALLPTKPDHRDRMQASTAAGPTLAPESSLPPPATATRSTSVSSVTSTDGSALSDDPRAVAPGGSAFVMPSLNLAGRTRTQSGRHATVHSTDDDGDDAASARSPSSTDAHSSSEPDPPTGRSQPGGGDPDSSGRARILVLGSSANDRRTLAKLVSLDDDDIYDRGRDDRTRQSAASSEGGRGGGGPGATSSDDMSSYSSLSTSHHLPAHATVAAAEPAAVRDRPFQALSPRAGAATFFHLAEATLPTARLLDELQMPFERLEAKISRSFPATDGLVDIVSSTAARCGAFDACLFLFSSPPTAQEVALARPVSRLLPLFPVLLLPPPLAPGKPQKTYALCHAVQEQLTGADVRWLPAASLEQGDDQDAVRFHGRGRGRTGTGGAARRGGGGPLFMLPHDLFSQHPPAETAAAGGPLRSSSSSSASTTGDSPTHFSSVPSSNRDSPPGSLSLSQELFAVPPPPLSSSMPSSPALTAMSSAPPSSIGTGMGMGTGTGTGTGQEYLLRGGGERPSRREEGRLPPIRSLLASGPPSTRAGSSVSRSDSRRPRHRRRRGAAAAAAAAAAAVSAATGGGGEGSSSSSSSESDSASESRWRGQDMYGSSTSLADLKRLQVILHDPTRRLCATLRRLEALAFLEWREVEIAAAAGSAGSAGSTCASGGRTSATERRNHDLPLQLLQQWGETLLENDNDGGDASAAAAGGNDPVGAPSCRRRTNARKGLDFSRRVAERRAALLLFAASPPDLEGEAEEPVENDTGAPISASTTRESTMTTATESTSGAAASCWTDPTTPRCVQRALPAHFTAATVAGGNRLGGEGYFPAAAVAAATATGAGDASLPWSVAEGHASASAPASASASASVAMVGEALPPPRSRVARDRPCSSPLSSILYLSPADPFHLPSLLHLVGLNLRLAFHPLLHHHHHDHPIPEHSVASSTSLAANDKVGQVEADTADVKNDSIEGAGATAAWSWWRAVATVGLVFAAGVAIGAQGIISRRAMWLAPSPTLTAAAALTASPADWASWSPAVLIRT